MKNVVYRITVERCRHAGRLITERYAFVVFGTGLMGLNLTFSVFLWWLSLKIASSLVASQVSELKDAISRCHPISSEWNDEVIPRVLALCDQTLPWLGEGWGDSVGSGFVGGWICGFGAFCGRGRRAGPRADGRNLLRCPLTR